MTKDEHDHEWTRCATCPYPGEPCACSGEKCSKCTHASGGEVSVFVAREEVLQAVRDLREEWKEKRYYAVEAMQLKNSFVASLDGLLQGFEIDD